jgi:hypothetical protein
MGQMAVGMGKLTRPNPCVFIQQIFRIFHHGLQQAHNGFINVIDNMLHRAFFFRHRHRYRRHAGKRFNQTVELDRHVMEYLRRKEPLRPLVLHDVGRFPVHFWNDLHGLTTK